LFCCIEFTINVLFIFQLFVLFSTGLSFILLSLGNVFNKSNKSSIFLLLPLAIGGLLECISALLTRLFSLLVIGLTSKDDILLLTTKELITFGTVLIVLF